METVDDAIRAGKTHLEVQCEPCRLMKQIPWRLLPGILGNHKLADIAAHMVCESCGARPNPESVRPWAQSEASGFAARF